MRETHGDGGLWRQIFLVEGMEPLAERKCPESEKG